MSKLKVKEVLLGDNADPSKNFVISTPAVADGTLTIKRGNGTAVLSIDANGKTVIPGVVGTVAQVGGIPTGQVVERGSNVNGEYVRFADGTQICRNIFTVSLVISTGYFGGFISPVTVWNFPANFASVGVPAVNGTCAGYSAFGCVVGSTTQSSAGVFLTSALSVTAGATRYIAVTAIGRWF